MSATVTKNGGQIIADLKQRLKSHFGNEIKSVVLFGSQTGETTDQSDYDIVIVPASEMTWQQKREMLDICYDVDLAYGIITDVHILCESEIQSARGRQPVFANAVEHGLYI